MVGRGGLVTVAVGFGVEVRFIVCEGLDLVGVKVKIDDFPTEHADNKKSMAARNISMKRFFRDLFTLVVLQPFITPGIYSSISSVWVTRGEG
jgi:hypothetical protein